MDIIAAPESPVLNLKEAAAYVRRTPKAMYGLRTRHCGPASFRKNGRIYYRLVALDAWLAEGEAEDSRSNPALNPLARRPEPRLGRRHAAAA